MVLQAANHGQVVLEATDDQERRCLGILDLDGRGLDRPGGESSLAGTGDHAVGNRSCERSRARHDHHLVDLARDRFLDDAVVPGHPRQPCH